MKPKLMAKQLQYKKMHYVSIQIMVQVWVPIKQDIHGQNEKKRNHRSGRNDQKEKKWKFTETQHP